MLFYIPKRGASAEGFVHADPANINSASRAKPEPAVGSANCEYWDRCDDVSGLPRGQRLHHPPAARRFKKRATKLHAQTLAAFKPALTAVM